MEANHFTGQIAFVGAKFEFIPGSNTFRVGNKYCHVKPGDILDAVEPSGVTGNKDLGPLTVRAVHIMRLRDALIRFASKNHAIVELGHGGNHAGSAAVLNTALASVYPAHATDNGLIPLDTIFTVIEFS